MFTNFKIFFDNTNADKQIDDKSIASVKQSLNTLCVAAKDTAEFAQSISSTSISSNIQSAGSVILAKKYGGGTTKDAHKKFNLKDLNSRLKNIFSTEIKDPTTETMKILIANLLSNHQIKLSANQLDDIISNLPRSYSSIDLILKKINFFLLENGDKISKNNIAQIIK